MDEVVHGYVCMACAGNPLFRGSDALFNCATDQKQKGANQPSHFSVASRVQRLLSPPHKHQKNKAPLHSVRGPGVLLVDQDARADGVVCFAGRRGQQALECSGRRGGRCIPRPALGHLPHTQQQCSKGPGPEPFNGGPTRSSITAEGKEALANPKLESGWGHF